MLGVSGRNFKTWLKKATLINGVRASMRTDGHPQGEAEMFALNPFGGMSWFDKISRGYPLGTLYFNRFPDKVDRSGGVMLSKVSHKDWQEVTSKLNERPALDGYLSSIWPDNWAQKDTRLIGTEMDRYKTVDFLSFAFSNKLTNCAYIPYRNVSIDSHQLGRAKKSKKSADGIVRFLDRTLTGLSERMLPNGQSILDASTVVITSEFSRTLRQIDSPIDRSGTDHNLYNNSWIFLGRGVPKDKIIGGSDLHDIDIVNNPGRSLDPDYIRPMARELDPKTLAFGQGLFLRTGHMVAAIEKSFGEVPNTWAPPIFI